MTCGSIAFAMSTNCDVTLTQRMLLALPCKPTNTTCSNETLQDTSCIRYCYLGSKLGKVDAPAGVKCVQKWQRLTCKSNLALKLEHQLTEAYAQQQAVTLKSLCG